MQFIHPPLLMTAQIPIGTRRVLSCGKRRVTARQPALADFKYNPPLFNKVRDLAAAMFRGEGDVRLGDRDQWGGGGQVLERA